MVIWAPGIDPIDVMLSIGSDSEVMVLPLYGAELINDDGTSGPRAYIASANSSEVVPGVTGLPSTGSGTPADLFPLMVFSMAALGLMAISSGIRRCLQ